jgi:hypothetical protein
MNYLRSKIVMKRNQKGAISIIVGILLFFIGLLVLLPINQFYLASLFILFIACVLIAVGGAMMKGFDASLETPTEDCYYCQGSGMIDSETGEKETCPRCGGTGLARLDD